MNIEQVPVSFDENKNRPVLNFSSTLLNDDWIRSARIKEKADAGDEDAKAEITRLDSTRTFVKR